MYETGRRSAISTSELGLYSDRVDRYNRNRYGPIVRKIAIGVMVLVGVVLVAIFLYDFTSATSVNSKVNQETKHIYILQNALKKTHASKRWSNNTNLDVVANGTSVYLMQDRSDNEDREEKSRELASEESLVEEKIEPEYRAQNINNFKLRKRVLKSIENEENNDELAEKRQLFDNHAVVYRVRQRLKRPDSDDEDESSGSEERQPTPFHWEYKTPHPMSFVRPKYPQLTQYRYPYASRSIQDIIKYLTADSEMPSRGIKFAGVYVNPKKYDYYPEFDESEGDRSDEEESSIYPVGFGDPFYQYKPKHPADVNLLATSNVRFAPTGTHRYNPYYDPMYQRPNVNYYNKPSSDENYGSYSNQNSVKKRKPKPFSVMLDIYPITDMSESSKKITKPRPMASMDDYDYKRPMQYNRVPKYYGSAASPLVNLPGSSQDEEEKQQMIFHLNLYPRRKNKLTRQDIIRKSESMLPEERQQLMDKIMTPLDNIAKQLVDHSNVQGSSIEDAMETTTQLNNRYQEIPLEIDQATTQNILDEDTTATENIQFGDTSFPNRDQNDPRIFNFEAQKIVVTTAETITSTFIENTTEKRIDTSKDIDTVEGFERFKSELSLS